MSNAESKDVRAEMVRAQDPRPDATYTVGCTTVTCPATTRPGHAVRVAKAVQRLLKEMSARGEWGIAYNRVHVPPQERGRTRKG